jgi:hypothetical protein
MIKADQNSVDPAQVQRPQVFQRKRREGRPT